MVSPAISSRWCLSGQPRVRRFLARTVSAAGPARGNKRLVAIFQRGAVDGLSMIAPVGDDKAFPGSTDDCRRASGGADAGIDLDGSLRSIHGWRHSPFFNSARPGHCACHGSPDATTLALRRAGLHGDSDARR